MATSRKLHLEWYNEKFSFNPSELITTLPTKIKEQIFERVTDYHNYPESSDETVYKVQALLREIQSSN